MATKAEAQQPAGETLKLVPIGQAMQSHHSVRLGESYDEVYAILQVKSLAIWDSTAEMPDEITPYFVTLMAHNKMDLIGVSATVYQRILFKAGDEGEKAITSIRTLVNNAFVNNQDVEDY